MKKSNLLLTFILLLSTLFTVAQQRPEGGRGGNPEARPKVKVTGSVVEKVSKQPLAYATITLTNTKNPKAIAGGITDENGKFSVDATSGIYDIKVEFISFKALEFKQKTIKEDTNLGTISLSEDANELNEVVIRAEKSTVEIKLDKKVYNVGQDMLVKGGTVSDVLENVPSVSVDVEGNVSLRGNENVRIFIDGRPSNSLNMADALRQIPADAIDKVEVITNPSARYDAEGGAGILNIVLKKGKNMGFNGSIIASTGIPETYGLSANLNYKTEKLNFFTTTGYNYRTSEGTGLTNSKYYDIDGSTKKYIYEDRDNERLRKGISTKTGFEWTVAPNTYWTNSISYRNNNGTNNDLVTYNNYNADQVFTFTQNRLSTGTDDGSDFEYNSNFLKKFNEDGHQLTVDASLSTEDDYEDSVISDEIINSNIPVTYDYTYNKEHQKQLQLQADYVLPFGEGQQFEAGYKGSYSNLSSIYSVNSSENESIDGYLSNNLQYIERINAVYAQYGFKVNKFSYLFGLRWEDTNLDINLLDTQDYNSKKYNKFFPSAFVNYEISEKSSLSASYSKRLSRPRGRFLNPATNYTSNINLFRGNPDLNPSFSDKFDLGYLMRWEKLTLSSSFYYQYTTDVFSFVRLETGEFVDGTPVILNTPINLATENEFGFEFNLNYNPFKIWKINGSFNLAQSETTGVNTYTNTEGIVISQNLDNETFSWFARVNSRLTLPLKIEWQASAMYVGPRSTAQGNSLGQIGVNTSFSKDILKENATIAFNVSDIFNSRKMKIDTYLPSLESYSEFQWRKRQFNLSFTYRFNKKKTDKDKNAPKGNGDEGGDFPG